MSQFSTATLISTLGPGSTVVDCPACKTRGVTRTMFVAGNTTQYVYLQRILQCLFDVLYFISSASGQLYSSSAYCCLAFHTCWTLRRT
jgi:hypothetical protein